jgi:GTP-sensing pleiotropic transcriptional regulator CodY
MSTPTVTRIPNQGAMGDFIKPFEVASKMTDMVYRVRFSHMWNAIATRHADTIDCKFYVDGKGVVLGLIHTAFVEFRDRYKRGLTDRESSFIAAEYLRERLEQEDEHELYDVAHKDVMRIVEKLGIR